MSKSFRQILSYNVTQPIALNVIKERDSLFIKLMTLFCEVRQQKYVWSVQTISACDAYRKIPTLMLVIIVCPCGVYNVSKFYLRDKTTRNRISGNSEILKSDC